MNEHTIKKLNSINLKVDELIKKNKETNMFIIEIAKLLDMDIDGVGFDDHQFTIEDFEEAINILNK